MTAFDIAGDDWDPKDPDDVATYWFNWDRDLPVGLTIVSAEVVLPVGDLAFSQVGGQNIWIVGRMVGFRPSGGTVGSSYPIDNTITTNDGQVLNITKTLEVEERIE